jgi:hypothetical protein
MDERKFKFLGRYRQDPGAIVTAAAVTVMSVLFCFVAAWYVGLGFWLLVLLIAYLKRNSP